MARVLLITAAVALLLLLSATVQSASATSHAKKEEESNGVVKALESAIDFLSTATKKPEPPTNSAAPVSAGKAEGGPSAQALAKEATGLWSKLVDDTGMSPGMLRQYKRKVSDLQDVLVAIFGDPVAAIRNAFFAGRVRNPEACISPLTQLKLLHDLAEDADGQDLYELFTEGEGKVAMQNFISCFSEEDFLSVLAAALRIAKGSKDIWLASDDEGGSGSSLASAATLGYAKREAEKKKQKKLEALVSAELLRFFKDIGLGDEQQELNANFSITVDDIIRIGGRNGAMSTEDEEFYRTKFLEHDANKDGTFSPLELDNLFGHEMGSMASSFDRDTLLMNGAKHMLKTAFWWVFLVVGGLLFGWSLFTILVWEALKRIWRWIRGGE